MNRISQIHGARIAELWRYYKVGVVNTAFGFGLYSLLVFLGLNLFIAQIVSHVTGAAFNYFMYSTHVFKGTTARIVPYIASYSLNYVIGLSCLGFFHQFIHSPYLAGVMGLVASSIVNYLLLKAFVFKDLGRRK